ncbi:ATP-dependent helicase [Pseudoalteromonas sp. SMS1]|uniref:UvrD-helicase domain-containing protein n=1 Tax=Pseudoalteromonas sp. SMS1 TaxID=2908894 RepID=UPI001F1A25D0|nr:ATP-dependent helicase [Pseudoalteromonas sp. SMS1]MCF2855928.1 ATP-dependent helicase [Pseudoalteromonas sp. SMS1]
MPNLMLTGEQLSAVNYEGSIVITACPGSGKTTVVKEKIKQVTSTLPSHKGIIAITFTKKASSELKKRCNENAHDTKNSFFGTIDSFCLNELIIPFLGRIWGNKPSNCKVVKKLAEPEKYFLAEQYTSPTTQDIQVDGGFKELYGEGILWMQSFAALSVLILEQSEAARRYIKARYSNVYMDEYQDSSYAQHELFKKLYDLGLIATAVGDVNQSIYGFRGSRPELLLELAKADNFEHFELTANHRCHPSIVNYASRVLNPNFQATDCEGDIQVYRKEIDGNLSNAAELISNWIKDWVVNSDIKECEIGILAKKDVSLDVFSSGLKLDYRLYRDTPLNKIGSECADIYSSLLALKFGAISTVQEIIDIYQSLFKPKLILEQRAILNEVRNAQNLQSFFGKAECFLETLGVESTEQEINALELIWNNESLIKLFKPITENELQLMTLHKAKGLEFKIVFHLDMEEWSFPHRIPGQNFDDINYPNLQEDKNLHYVGITRAKLRCYLIHVSLRLNRHRAFGNSRRSYFLRLPELEGLYQ